MRDGVMATDRWMAEDDARERCDERRRNMPEWEKEKRKEGRKEEKDTFSTVQVPGSSSSRHDRYNNLSRSETWTTWYAISSL
jgi:hypothetical protein